MPILLARLLRDNRAPALHVGQIFANTVIDPDQTASSSLMEIRLSETFSGDIDGESPARASQVVHDDKSASLVSMQRFHGKLCGRKGTFVHQGSEMVENGRIKATWFVVPRSGTGDLAGAAWRRGVLKATLEKGPTDGWIIGSNEELRTYTRSETNAVSRALGFTIGRPDVGRLFRAS